MFHNRLVYFVIFIFLCIPSIVFASEKMSVICHNEDQYVICSINGYADYQVVALEANIGYSSNLALNKFINDNLWLGDASNDMLALFGMGTDGLGEFNIGDLKFSNKNNVSSHEIVKFSSIRFADSSYKWHYLDDVTADFNIKYSSNVSEKDSLITLQLILIILGAILLLTILFIVVLYCIKHINDNSIIYIRRKSIIFVLIILIIILIFLYLFFVKRPDFINKNYIDYSCNRNGDNLYCKLTGYSNYDISGIRFGIEDYQNINVNELYDWQGYYKNGKLEIFSFDEINNNFDICEFKIANYNGEDDILIKNIVFVDKDGYNHSIDDINIKNGKEKQ